MRRILMLSAGALLLTACGGADESGTIETEDGEATYTLDRDNGTSSVRITGEDGAEYRSETGGDIDVDLPDGYSIYPGASVVSSTTMSQGGGGGVMVMMQSDDAPDALVSYYRDQAEAAGIDISMTVESDINRMIAGEGPEGRTFSFSATGNSDGTTGQLVVGQDIGG